MKAFNHYKKIQGIAALRLHLGLSQELFAMELGISRSLLSKAENKKRSLPSSALIKLSALEIKLSEERLQAQHTIHAAPVTQNSLPHTDVFLIMQQQRKKYLAEAAALQGRLRKMALSYNELLKTLALVEDMISGAAASSRFLPALLPIHRYRLLRKLQHCEPVNQARLKTKIMLLQAAAALQLEDMELLTIKAGTSSMAYQSGAEYYLKPAPPEAA